MTNDQGPHDHLTNINIQIAPRFRAEVDEGSLRRVAAEVLRQEGVAGETELSLIITDECGCPHRCPRLWRGN